MRQRAKPAALTRKAATIQARRAPSDADGRRPSATPTPTRPPRSVGNHREMASRVRAGSGPPKSWNMSANDRLVSASAKSDMPPMLAAAAPIQSSALKSSGLVERGSDTVRELIRRKAFPANEVCKLAPAPGSVLAPSGHGE